MKKRARATKEKLVNVPNFFTLLRVFLAVLLVILYFTGFSIMTLLYFFIFAAFTDFLDGFFARKLKQETLFGARFDILADRFLWIIFGLILIFGYTEQGYYNLLYFLLIFSREILCGLFLFVHIFIFGKRNFIPYVRYSGKITTLIQGVVIPSMILSEVYHIFNFYKSLIVLCLFFGVLSAFYYIVDLEFNNKLMEGKFKKYYNLFNPIATANYNLKK